MAWILGVLLAVGCWLLLEKFSNIPHDAKEPPLIPQPIPYVGHLLGMLRHGSRYYTAIKSVPAHDGHEDRPKSLTQVQCPTLPSDIHSSCASEQDICRELTQSCGGCGPSFKSRVVRPLRCSIRQTDPSSQPTRTGCFGGKLTRGGWRLGLPARNAQSDAPCFISRGELGPYNARHVRQCF